MSKTETQVELVINNNQTSFSIGKVKGKLDSVIVDTTSKIGLVIESELGYFVFKDREVSGVKYFAPRVRTRASEMDLLDHPGWDYFNLNEVLYITAIGPNGTKVKVTLRYC